MNDIIGAYSSLQDAFAGLATVVPLGYAFAAGMVAAVNPCGFVALPSFGFYYLGLDGTSDHPAGWASRLSRALLAGLFATLGFLVLFTAVGLTIAIVGFAAGAIFPVVSLGLGVMAVAIGLWALATGNTFGLTALDRIGLPAGTGPRPAFVFGLGYGLLSLGCTLPIFLGVATTSLALSLPQAALQFALYAGGMGLVITALALSAALGGGALARRLSRFRGWAPRVGGVFMILSGLFVVYYFAVFGRLFA